jgi:hypothetical protein
MTTKPKTPKPLKPKPIKTVKIPKVVFQSPHVNTWCYGLKAMGIEFVVEHQFHDVRKFRFDVAIPALKLGIEYEGIFSEKSRHTAPKGYSTDCEKYNLATVEGWRVLRYTALNYQNMFQDIHTIINQLRK